MFFVAGGLPSHANIFDITPQQSSQIEFSLLLVLSLSMNVGIISLSTAIVMLSSSFFVCVLFDMRLYVSVFLLFCLFTIPVHYKHKES